MVLASGRPSRVAALAETFVAGRPCVPAAVVRELWQYWQSDGPDRPLFDDNRQDVALVLHARAHGERVRLPGEHHGHPALSGRASWFDPVCPPALPWGAGAALSPKIQACEDSPVLHAWVFRDGGSPTLVFIAGRGTPEIRARVLPAAMMASLRLGVLDTDHVGVGFHRIEYPLGNRPMLDLPVTVLGLPTPSPLAGGADAGTGREPLHELVAVLRDLQDRTGLVRLSYADVTDWHRFRRTLGRLPRRARDSGRPLVWAPGAVPSGADQVPRLVGIEPIRCLPSGRPLDLAISGDLLATPAYRELQAAFQRSTLDRVKSDVRTRKELHDERVHHLWSSHRAYVNTPEQDRVAVWGDSVELNVRFDVPTGLIIKLPVPEFRDADLYYLTDVPQMAKQHEALREQMAEIETSLDRAVEDPEGAAPLPRLAAGRYLDAAVRHRHADESPLVESAYRQWSRQVQPMLWLEWRTRLEEAGIALADAFTPHTVMHTWFDQGDDGLRLLMMPFNLVDSLHSAVLADPVRAAVVVRDASDYARPAGAERPPDARQAEAQWQDLVSPADPRSRDEDEFARAFMEALRAAPRETVERALTELGCRMPPAGADVAGAVAAGAVAAAEPVSLTVEGHLNDALRAAAVVRGVRRAADAINAGAVQTARLSLDMIENPGAGAGALTGEVAARVALLTSLIEYHVQGRNIKSAGADFNGRGDSLPPRCATAVDRAYEADRGFTERWLERLDAIGFERAYAVLLRGLPRLDDVCHVPEHQAALASRAAAESARLAREIEQAAERLSDDGEPIITVFAKIGRQLDAIFLAEHAGGARSAAIDLLELLTQIARPQLGDG